jgi:hypothetical protein
MASEAWAGRDYAKAVRMSTLAVGMTRRAGRGSQAAVHLERLERLRRAGDLEGALAECALAVQALGLYDDEGAVSYLCTETERQIRSADPGAMPLQK